ncbi:Pentatricopeptide repeat-containing protein [Acorus calamus]|uniref:Pentatricopeptide repeat-containing protein n=1 Tax=Acorus calamus TaxID=4465 RepID=A0AAV9CF88_ACOCL|nr:Pentatricopeptide repeat-containing protein [Acorus calamus]
MTTSPQKLHLFRVRPLRAPKTPSPPPPSPPISALIRSSATQNLRLCRATHARIVTSGLSSDRFLTNNLLTSYSKCGSLSDSVRVFFDRSRKTDVVAWNSLLAAYASHGHAKEGLCLFRLMLRSSVPLHRLTFPPLLKLCSSSDPDGCATASEAIHCCSIKSGLESDGLISSALVGMYCKLGSIRSARLMFDGMSKRDLVLWNLMIRGYRKLGFAGEAFCLFSELHRSELRPDAVSVRCIVGGGFENSNIDQVRVYGIKAGLFSIDSDSGTALGCFSEIMKSSTVSGDMSVMMALKAATRTGDFSVGARIHCVLMKNGLFLVVPLANSLINIYAKLGRFDYAWRVFNMMEDLDLVTWNTMITNSVRCGLNVESISLLLDMLWCGFRPDQFTLASVLRACSSVDESSSLCRQIHVFALKTGESTDVFVITALIGAYAHYKRMGDAELLYHRMGGFDLGACHAMIAGYMACGDQNKALNLISNKNIPRKSERQPLKPVVVQKPSKRGSKYKHFR